ncbi:MULTISPECIES: endonuclease MutS2 [Bacillaceae]|uniref:Endonuclease MutS2 n=1 Tax=Evansella alkalicola TaxID=745819 RepID=A0ABS6JSZ4_9BACI|nr:MULTISPECIES: DNA mismatch repair protein [Bacillaceae]MBU9721693.1 endonuclease MutS2 [Bacillus alkalicola]
MKNHTMKVLQYDMILQDVANHALTNRGKETIKQLSPTTNKQMIERLLNEVTEAVGVLNISGSVPIHSLDEIITYLEQANKGLFLRPDQLTSIISFLDHCTKLKRFMKDKSYVAPTISLYTESIGELSDLESEIQRCLRHGKVDDYASQELARVRKQINILVGRLKDKANQMTKSRKYNPYLQEHHIFEKNGHLVLAIKREFRNKVNGTVIESSASGATLFIEPNELSELQEEIQMLRYTEEYEVEQVLYTLTGMILEKESEIKVAVDVMHQYDVIFAKGKYSRQINGCAPELNEEYMIDLREARHPMLGMEAVPLTLCFGETDRALIITGPNTGGKTVTLKTIGLLTMMAQTGLHIPAEKGTNLQIFHHIFVDIGDGQSIEQNLSTFSSRLVNIIEILQETNEQSLVLLDELGSGTDPGEGMGLAIALMEQLFEKGATMFATTHYSEMKDFANEREGFMIGSMEFDLETLRPTYRLLLGEGGKSQAFDIALKLGLHPKIIEKAHQITYKQDKKFEIERPEVLKQSRFERQIERNKYARNATKSVINKVEDKVTLFSQGDNVRLPATGEMGIVYKGPDEMGNYVVQVKGEKRKVNHKRLSLYVAASQLYPEDYDFDIVFKSKEYRKKKHMMDRKFVEGLVIEEE